MKTSLSDMKEFLENADDAIAKQSQLLFGNTVAAVDKLAGSAKYQEILKILHDQPILVEPTLNWLRNKTSELATAQLSALYTPEELEELRKRM